MNDLYLIHQQGWEGAAEHISQPDRIAWKSMCATSEGREKGEKWCKRAIWGNTLPALKKAWKSVDKVTSEAFVGMWRARVAEFYSKYMATAIAAGAKQSFRCVVGRSCRIPPPSPSHFTIQKSPLTRWSTKCRCLLMALFGPDRSG